MHQADVSLITTVFNEGDNIGSFLESYRRQSALAFEVVIVDGGSTDGTATVIAQFAKAHPSLNIRLIVDESCSRRFSKGPIARGRNRAIMEARGPLIAVTDAGCRMEHDWLQEITAPFRAEPATDVVAGFYRTADHTPFLRKYAAVFIPLEEDFLPSSRSIAFRKSCWEKVGGYPEGSYTAEDTIFDLKLLKAGFSFVPNKKALVTWQFARDKEELVRKLKQYSHDEGVNRMFGARYLFRLGALLFPPLMLAKLVLEGRRKELTIGKLYFFYWHQCRGYFSGLIDGMRHER